MSKKIISRFFACTLFIIILFNLFCLPKSHASDSISNVFSSGKDFLGKGNSIDDTLNVSELQNTSSYIYNALLGVAVMVAIIVAMVIGIQFMAASADEKAKVKEAILPFIVGCIVVFGAFAIWKIAVNIGNDAESKIKTTSTTYTKKDGKLYCDNCGGELSTREQHSGKCSNCGQYVKGI